MARGQLKDPAEEANKDKQAKDLEDEVKTFDITGLDLSDFAPVGQEVAKSPHPFDGYPVKKIKVGTYRNPRTGKKEDLMWPQHAIVALNPKEYVHQDPSGKNVSIGDRIVTLKTHHNRMVQDFENGGQNTKIVFDRTIELKDGTTMDNCAYVPSHSCRAQLIFKLDDRAQRIMVDNRYMLADRGQNSRLRRVFEMIVNPRIANERLARAIAGESNETPDAIPET